MEKFLSELEITKIEAFCKDAVMFTAVKKVLLQSIYTQGVIKPGEEPMEMTKNLAFLLAGQSLTNPIPDEILGQHLRATWAGINALMNGFNELEALRKEEEVVESPYNEAV